MKKNEPSESQWLDALHPTVMFDILHSVAKKQHEPQLRLFVARCCRRMESLLPDSQRRHCFDIIDRWGHGLASLEAVGKIVYESLDGWQPKLETEIGLRENVSDALEWLLTFDNDPVHAARMVAMRARVTAPARGDSDEDEANAQASMLREIVANPFQE